MLTSNKLSIYASSVCAIIASSYGIYTLFRNFFVSNQTDHELKQAYEKIKILTAKLLQTETFDNRINSASATSDVKEIRIWMDGVFDLMHFGHMNAFRQARALGTYLIVGVNSDETIKKCKGPPVMYDQVVNTLGVPYIMNEDYIHFIINKYKVDYIVHGDDPCIVDGKDVYEAAIKLGKYLTIPRTEGISTTDIVGRILQHSGSHPNTGTVRTSDFFTTSHVLRMYSTNNKPPGVDERVVYVAGGWDLLNNAHIRLLQLARSFGDYLLVGVYSDLPHSAVHPGNIRSIKFNSSATTPGQKFPVLTLQERVLGVLGCSCVGDVLIDAPQTITDALIKRLHIALVIAEKDDPLQEVRNVGTGSVDPLAVPRSLGILHTLSLQDTTGEGRTAGSENDDHSTSGGAKLMKSICPSSSRMIRRILGQREKYEESFAKKKLKEESYYSNKYDAK